MSEVHEEAPVTQAQIFQMETHLDNAKKLVEIRDGLQKLSKNHEFRKYILEEFCVQECARYARESADPALPEHARADALAIAQAAGHLKRWLSIQIQIGNSAEGQMEQIEDELTQMRAEVNE